MFQLLRQPYPTEEPIRRRLLKSLGSGAFIALFLLAFQPFGIDDWETDAKTLKILGFGLVATVVLLVNWLLLPRLFPRFFSDAHWTVGREIGRVLFFIMVIATGNWLYLFWLLNRPLTVKGWLWTMNVTFLAGIFPTVASVVANYIVQLRRYSQQAAQLPLHSPMSPPDNSVAESSAGEITALTPGSTLTLTSDNEKEELRFPASDLLFIESADNYCTVHYLSNGQPAKPLLRSSLSRLAGQITVPHIVRCHRSYVVNLDRVERVTGNAQGYKLHLLGGTYRIPVARQYNDTLVAELKGL